MLLFKRMLIELEYILKLSSNNSNKSPSVKAGVLVTAKKKKKYELPGK